MTIIEYNNIMTNIKYKWLSTMKWQILNIITHIQNNETIIHIEYDTIPHTLIQWHTEYDDEMIQCHNNTHWIQWYNNTHSIQ